MPRIDLDFIDNIAVFPSERLLWLANIFWPSRETVLHSEPLTDSS